MKAACLLAALMAALALAPAAAQAAASGGFGVTPVALDLTDPPLLRGAVAEGTLRLQNREATPMQVNLVPEGPIATWVSVDVPSTITLAPGETKPVRVRVAVPDTAPNGDHAGYLRLRAAGAGEPKESGATTQVELLPVIRVRITGEQVVAFALERATIADPAPDAPLVVEATLLNRGNVRESAPVGVVVRARDGPEVHRETLTTPPFAPGTQVLVELATTRGLPAGLYTATVSLPAERDGGAITIDFESRKGGSTKVPVALPAGDVVEFVVPSGLAAGKPAAFGARFQNDGPVDIAGAKLTVEIHRGAERVGVATSDALRIAAGETMLLDAFWTPDEEGEHVARAYVTYDGLRTPARSASFQVGEVGASARGGAPSDGGSPVPGPGALLALLGVAAAALALARRR